MNNQVIYFDTTKIEEKMGKVGMILNTAYFWYEAALYGDVKTLVNFIDNDVL